MSERSDLRPKAGALPRTLGFFVFLPVLTGCGSTTEPLLTTWTGDLEPVPPATVGGQVAAVTQFGRTQTSIQLAEAEPGSTYTWQIAAGTCQAPGEIQGGAAAYPPLTPGEGGTASAEAVLSAVFKADRQFAARVLRSDGGGGEGVVACGELVQTG